MPTKAAVPLLLLLIVLMAGCASTQSSSMPPADVNGTWTGSMVGGARTYTLVLKQTGTLSGAGTADGPIEGIVDGNTIKLREQGGPSETPALTVKGDQITGWIRGTTLTLNRAK